MKNAVLGALAIAIIILISITIMTVSNRSVRKNELDTNLNQALKRSMEILTVDPKYNYAENEEFISDLVQDMLTGTTTDSTFKINIKNLDLQKGILDVEVTEMYQQILGKSSIQTRKQIVLEDWNNDDNVYYKVSFQVDDAVVKQWNVHGGDALSSIYLPQSLPEKKGYTLIGWKLASPSMDSKIYTTENIQDVVVMQETTFQAVYEEV